MGLIGSLLTIIGILTLGVLLVSIFAISLSARALTKTNGEHISFRERLEAAERASKEKDEKRL